MKSPVLVAAAVVITSGVLLGQPVGVTVARDGSLLVSDDGSNVIWKVRATK